MTNKQVFIPELCRQEDIEKNSLVSYKITDSYIHSFTDQEIDVLRQQITELRNQFENSDPNLRDQYITKINVELEMVLRPQKIQILVEPK